MLRACAGGREAVEQTVALQPRLLFLDVQMPDLDGFGVLGEISGKACPATVFVTAFDQYAVRAFDVHAVDYLLKPYDTARFRDAFTRAKDRLQGDSRGVAATNACAHSLAADYVAAQQTAIAVVSRSIASP